MIDLFEKKIGGMLKKHVGKLRAKFKKLTNVNKMTKTLFKTVMSKIKGALSLDPQSKKDYIKMGSTYIAKKVLMVSVLLLLVVLFLFNRYLYPWAEGRFWTPEIVINTDKYYIYTGKAKVLNSNHDLLYVGQMQSGRITGEGSLYDPVGNMLYRGEFMQEQYSGVGERYRVDGSLEYKGQFANNIYNGEGQYFENDQLFYEGEFKDGLFHGQGKQYHFNGNLWIAGTYSMGKLEGEGKVYNPSGELMYQGFFMDGLYSGIGTEYNTDTKQIIYEGQFRKGLYDGIGKLYDLELGRIVYEGEFSEGKYHGEGTLHNWKGQNVYKGHFYKGEIDYFRYIDAPIATVREEFGNETEVYFFENHYLTDYKQLSMLFSFENPETSLPIVNKVIFVGEQDFLGGPIGMPISHLQNVYGDNASEFYYLLDEEKKQILNLLRLSTTNDTLYSVRYIIHDDIFIRYYALNPDTDILYFEMGGL